MIQVVAFDFGGVLAEEGFKEGLGAIGKMNGLSPQEFSGVAGEIAYRIGYVTGIASEEDFWSAVRKETGITQSDAELRKEILGRFKLRPVMLRFTQRIRASGYRTVILSDQTNWLEEIHRATPFLDLFDEVFNSFRMHRSKRDTGIFRDVCASMRLRPAEVIFIDDNEGNIQRASGAGMRAIHFKGVADVQEELGRLIYVK